MKGAKPFEVDTAFFKINVFPDDFDNIGGIFNELNGVVPEMSHRHAVFTSLRLRKRVVQKVSRIVYYETNNHTVFL